VRFFFGLPPSLYFFGVLTRSVTMFLQLTKPQLAEQTCRRFWRNLVMTKTLKCGDVVPGCPAKFQGDSEQEVLKQAAEHAKTAHNLDNIPPEVMSKVKAAIHDDNR
jgi:predicted small metal-binding protein